ncbi:MAG: transcriptional regulator [Gammaproteobacteria bacterium]|nr:transcriptional regulator [Gammaproteobacteria bacterium]
MEDDSITLHKSKGNGVLRRQIWVNNEGKVTRYSLAYINHLIYAGDNGRVLGFDNAHDYHHKHYMGNIEPVVFKTFSELEEQFQREFEVIHAKIKKIK